MYMKRDDLLGLAGGGSKTRKLEFLMADALASGADTVITCGAVQSNHCRLTLAASVKEGLPCRFVLEERVPGSYDPHAKGNNFLFHLLGVERISVVPGGSDMARELRAEADRAVAEGRTPYVIAEGGSCPVGDTGYAACAREILSQVDEMGVHMHAVVCVSGSGGTHAGLVTGFFGSGVSVPVLGINVIRGKAVQEARVREMVRRTAAHVGIGETVPGRNVVCFDEYVGPGYSLPTAGMAEAVRLVAATEGIVLDPVYTGKAMAGLIDLIRKGYFKKEDNVLFLHTGGSQDRFHFIPHILDD